MEYSANFWFDELKRYKEDYSKFTEAGKKIIARFRDERKSSENTGAKFNILWSNFQTLKPAVYSKPPKIEVSRRFKDRNDVSRVASSILERMISYEINQFNDYNTALSNAVDDRLLVGRGVAWVRYEPETEEISQDELMISSFEESEEAPPLERIVSEHVCVDYISWQDFAHDPARTWEEVSWVARRVFMSEDEGVERFGDVFLNVPLTHSPDKEKYETTRALKKAVVWEIWCKSSQKVYWVAESFDEILDERNDPLGIDSFFPCPKPIFATVTTDSLVPVADFKQYQDQADEIDEITSRIQHLTKALKVMGIYAADEPALTRLLKEGQDAVMVPVQNWQSFTEKGGLSGAIQFVPLNDVVQALHQLYVSRDACKQMIYETTGISDILRGASLASETATAQQIKSQFASIRLNSMKDDVARFARDILRMKAEIICSKYQPETILQASGILYTGDDQFVPQAIALLKNEPLRNFQIDIQSDTLVQINEQEDKQSRIEFLTAASQFLEKSLPMAQAAPDIQPLLVSMLLFGVRGFKIGRDLEGEFEKFSDGILIKLQNQQNQPPQQQPNPDMIKLQMENQFNQAKLQNDKEARQKEIESKAQIMQARIGSETNRELIRQEAETQRTREKIAADMEIARIGGQISAAQMAIEQNKINESLNRPF